MLEKLNSFSNVRTIDCGKNNGISGMFWRFKVADDEVSAEIQKQVKGMPGQEKMVLEYYQKNPSASQNLKGSLYEEKIINLIKSKIKLNIRQIETKEAEKIISDFNKPNIVTNQSSKSKLLDKNKLKSKKISKK